MEQFTVREYIVREIDFHGVFKQETVGEIVRCKDCKHRELDEGFYVCKLDTGDLYELGRNAEDDNWFCADGERKEDNE